MDLNPEEASEVEETEALEAVKMALSQEAASEAEVMALEVVVAGTSILATTSKTTLHLLMLQPVITCLSSTENSTMTLLPLDSTDNTTILDPTTTTTTTMVTTMDIEVEEASEVVAALEANTVEDTWAVKAAVDLVVVVDMEEVEEDMVEMTLNQIAEDLLMKMTTTDPSQ